MCWPWGVSQASWMLRSEWNPAWISCILHTSWQGSRNKTRAAFLTSFWLRETQQFQIILEGLLQSLFESPDLAVCSWKAEREKWAGPSEKLRASEAGIRHSNGQKKEWTEWGVQRSPQQRKATRTGFVASVEEKAERKDSSPDMFKISTERKKLLFSFFLLQVHCAHSDRLKIAVGEILEERSDKHLSGVVLVELILPGGREMDSKISQGPSTLSPVTQNSPLEAFTPFSSVLS